MGRFNYLLTYYSPQMLESVKKGGTDRNYRNSINKDIKKANKTSASQRLIQYLILSLLIFSLVMGAVTYLLALSVRRLAVNNLDHSTATAYTSAKSALYEALEEGNEALYEAELYDLLSGAIDFSVAEKTKYLDSDDKKLSEPEEIDGEYFAAAYDKKGDTVAELCSYWRVEGEDGDSFVPVPEDFNWELLDFRDKRTRITNALFTGWFDDDGVFNLTELTIRHYLKDNAWSTSSGTRLVYQADEAAYEGEELVTIRNVGLDSFRYEGSSSLRLDGVKYESLRETVEAVNDARFGGDDVYAHYGIFDLVYLKTLTVPGLEDGENYKVIIAARCSPLKTAMKSLWWVYATGFLLLLIIGLIFQSDLRRFMLLPLRVIKEGIEGTYRRDEVPPMWLEVRNVHEAYLSNLDRQNGMKNEITRLNSALNYAENAEHNRRMMISAIAHELKTPLSVVHSYAEGLKEHIAEEKREEYLDVILSEIERMDGMVYEMLDLSRLEAGRVKLARDEFSLSALIRATFEKFKLHAEEKGLKITMEPDGECMVLADEGRIGQVIENFASNALRYTPERGKIIVKTRSGNNRISFSIENSTERPFTEDELSKVWETFYRTDKSRSSKGTGLGLTIAKNIVELHGGRCEVHNTAKGVEFGFTLPK